MAHRRQMGPTPGRSAPTAAPPFMASASAAGRSAISAAQPPMVPSADLASAPGSAPVDPSLRSILENQNTMFEKINETFREFAYRGSQGRVQPKVDPFEGDEDPHGYLGFRMLPRN